MIIIEKSKGRKIDYTADGTVIVFGDDELTLDLAELQDDWDIHVTICYNKRHRLTTGRGGITYVAEIDIPAREYVESEEEDGGSVPAPLDMDSVTLALWGIGEEEEDE
jgi:hypothetical protein